MHHTLRSCSPAIAEQLQQPDHVHRFTLLRSFRRDEWSRWLDCAGGTPPSPSQPVMVFEYLTGHGRGGTTGCRGSDRTGMYVQRLLQSGALVQPFAAEITLGGYWLTRLQSRTETPAMQQFARGAAEYGGGVKLTHLPGFT